MRKEPARQNLNLTNTIEQPKRVKIGTSYNKQFYERAAKRLNSKSIISCRQSKFYSLFCLMKEKNLLLVQNLFPQILLHFTKIDNVK